MPVSFVTRNAAVFPLSGVTFRFADRLWHLSANKLHCKSEHGYDSDLCTRVLNEVRALLEIGLNLRVLHDRDLERFLPMIERWRQVETTSDAALGNPDFAFLTEYGSLFDEGYYIDGSGSAYRNYSWQDFDPAITFPRVGAILKEIEVTSAAAVLDFGCGVGFYVAALRARGLNAVGLDISRYAIDNSRADIRPFLDVLQFETWSRVCQQHFDIVIAKDVLEHVPERILRRVWNDLLHISRCLVVTVPTTDSLGVFINSKDELDFTHVVRWTKDSWLRHFVEWSGQRPIRINVLPVLCGALKGDGDVGTLCVIIWF